MLEVVPHIQSTKSKNSFLTTDNLCNLKTIKNIESALALFQEAAAKQAEATEQGDYKTGNKCYDEIMSVLNFLRQNNSIQSLYAFLSAPSVGVRLWAASLLLPTHEKESIRVLKEIKKMEGVHSLTAETTISEWRKGNLKFH